MAKLIGAYFRDISVQTRTLNGKMLLKFCNKKQFISAATRFDLGPIFLLNFIASMLSLAPVIT
jgi:hypothetical protein